MNHTFKLYRGYYVQNIIIDGKSMEQLDGCTFSSVGENHTIRAIFEKDEVRAEYTELKHVDSTGVQRSNPEKSWTAVKHTAVDTFDSTGNEI